MSKHDLRRETPDGKIVDMSISLLEFSIILFVVLIVATYRKIVGFLERCIGLRY